MPKSSIPRLCNADNCVKPPVAKGLCSAHYAQRRRAMPADTCSVDGCASKVYAKSWCQAHYKMNLNYGRLAYQLPRRGTACAVDGCTRPHQAKGWCEFHYRRWLKKGTPTPPSRATMAQFIFEIAAKYEGDQCLIWPFAIIKRYGYGKATLPGGKQGPASRFVCEAVYGAPPSPEYQAAHSCNNRACVNPRHLRWDTPAGNAADKLLHGTLVRGEQNYNAILTEDCVRKIRSLKGIMSPAKIARELGATKAAVLGVIRGKTWKHVP